MEKETIIEDLLKPRYKVIADYPGNQWKVGKVLTPSGKLGSGELIFNLYTEQATQGRLNRFPHLFKKLEWWEERKPEEMPQYIKRGVDV